MTQTDPRIRALAQEAAVKIKAIAADKEAEIAAVYADFRQKAQQIQIQVEVECLTQMKTPEDRVGSRASADDLHDASADPDRTSAVNESQGLNHHVTNN